ncbi:hypothetical protein D3C71_926630 [compost metagenome]
MLWVADVTAPRRLTARSLALPSMVRLTFSRPIVSARSMVPRRSSMRAVPLSKVSARRLVRLSSVSATRVVCSSRMPVMRSAASSLVRANTAVLSSSASAKRRPASSIELLTLARSPPTRVCRVSRDVSMRAPVSSRRVVTLPIDVSMRAERASVAPPISRAASPILTAISPALLRRRSSSVAALPSIAFCSVSCWVSSDSSSMLALEATVVPIIIACSESMSPICVVAELSVAARSAWRWSSAVRISSCDCERLVSRRDTPSSTVWAKRVLPSSTTLSMRLAAPETLCSIRPLLRSSEPAMRSAWEPSMVSSRS